MYEALIDPARRAKAAQDQSELRKTLGHRVVSDPLIAKYLNGQAREEVALRALDSKALTPEQRDHLFNQLAWALSAQGKFLEAAEVCPEEQVAAGFAARAAAVQHIGQTCDCMERAHYAVEGNAKGFNPLARTKIEKVWNGEQVIVLYRCVLCRGISASYG